MYLKWKRKSQDSSEPAEDGQVPSVASVCTMNNNACVLFTLLSSSDQTWFWKKKFIKKKTVKIVLLYTTMGRIYMGRIYARFEQATWKMYVLQSTHLKVYQVGTIIIYEFDQWWIYVYVYDKSKNVNNVGYG